MDPGARENSCSRVAADGGALFEYIGSRFRPRHFERLLGWCSGWNWRIVESPRTCGAHQSGGARARKLAMTAPVQLESSGVALPAMRLSDLIHQ